MDPVRTFSRTLYAENEEDARAEELLLRRRLTRAQKFVNEGLGFDAWSRDLDDHRVCIAFCVPDTIYDNEEICEQLEDWFRVVFGAHYLIFDGEWRESSVDEEYPDNCRYEVDWCGSRSRSVNIGAHFYMDIRPVFPTGKPPCDPVDRPFNRLEDEPVFPTWTVTHERPDCYTVNVVIRGLERSTDGVGEGHESTAPQSVLEGEH